MSIYHIEDLDPRTFISTLRNIDQYIATEKLDGVNLTIGVDLNGIVYTSREGKNGERFYTDLDFPPIIANDCIKSAHQSVVIIRDIIKTALLPGDAIEVEILFGRQPNAIVYGENHIVFLRPVLGDSNTLADVEIIHKLNQILENIPIACEVDVIEADFDTLSLRHKTVNQLWNFTTVPEITLPSFTFIDPLLNQFETWLDQPYVEESGFTNYDIVTINLSRIPKKDRETYKNAREQLIIAQQQYVNNIKDVIVREILHPRKSALCSVNLDLHEDIGIEGIVLRHISSGIQIKIVDRNKFTIINQFNHAVRNTIKNTVRNRMKFDIPHTSRELDINNSMLQQLADVFNIAKLGHALTVRSALMLFKGDTLYDTLINFSEYVAQRDIVSLKSAVQLIVCDTLKSVRTEYKGYLSTWAQISHTLDTGKVIVYSHETHIKTLEMYVQYHEYLNHLNRNICVSHSIPDILFALYEKQLKAIHQP